MTSVDLGELLRTSRPVTPDALRERVRAITAAAPAAPAPPRFRLPRLRLTVPVVVATAVAATALVAVIRPEHQNREAATGLGGYASTPSTAPTTLNGAVTDQARAAKSFTPSGTEHAAGIAPAPAAGTGRAVDYQAQIGLEVKNGDALSSATDRAQTIARNLGGYVVAVEYASSTSGSASLTLRVPTAKVQDAIAQLTALGKITSQHVQIQDLQEQLDQLSRQIAVLRGRIAHITALLADPALTPERRAQLQASRDQLQSELRGVRQQSAGISQQAALATIQLTLATKQTSTTPVPASRARRTLDEAGRILTWEGVALLYALVVVGPLALIGVLGWASARMRRRNIENRLLTRS